MIDAAILFPGLVMTIWKIRSYLNKQTYYLIGGLLLLFIFYSTAWLILPYFAYKFGYQHHFINRGLFHYIFKVKNSSSSSPLYSFFALSHYTSWFFTVWIICSIPLSFILKKFRYFQIFTLPAIIFLMLLNDPSFHIIMFAGLFFLPAVFVTNSAIEKYPRTYLILALFILLTIGMNIWNFYSNYFSKIQYPAIPRITRQNESSAQKTCLDEAVIRIYKSHRKQPLSYSCLRPYIK